VELVVGTLRHGDENTGNAIDFRAVDATVLERWWNLPSTAALEGKYSPVALLKA
jgi:uncharacterized protein (DUF1501 family)